MPIVFFCFEFFSLFVMLLWGLFLFKLELMAKGEIRDENVNRGWGNKLKMSKGAFDYGVGCQKGVGKWSQLKQRNLFLSCGGYMGVFVFQTC
jgi:hypothetical protein